MQVTLTPAIVFEACSSNMRALAQGPLHKGGSRRVRLKIAGSGRERVAVCTEADLTNSTSNKASGWYGAAARNLEPGSARCHIKVPFLKVLIKVQFPQGSTLKSSGSQGSRFHS